MMHWRKGGRGGVCARHGDPPCHDQRPHQASLEPIPHERGVTPEGARGRLDEELPKASLGGRLTRRPRIIGEGKAMGPYQRSLLTGDAPKGIAQEREGG